MDQDDISDPSDWKNTSLSALYPLDSNLRCLICKDFYTAPVITSCLHTFCSLCIRRSLSGELVCPACRTTNISNSGLRQNKVVAELVENFLAVRPRLLTLARNDPLPSKEEDRIQDDKVVVLESPSPPPPPPPPPPVQNPGISCPICQRPFRTAEQVDLHIDTCTGPLSSSSQTQSYNLRPPKPVPASSSNSNDISVSTSISKPIPVGTPLPKLNYAMYNESKLRSMLAEQGLSTIGNKALLSARHKEFVNLHNANIDRRYPLSRQEILKQLEIWDATVSRQEKRKELDGVEWGRKFGDSFADLTKLARESMKRRKIGEEDDGEGTKTGVTEPSSQGETVA